MPLGRRFRALKLWFLLRAHGLEGLRTMIRNHVAWSEGLAERLRGTPDFEIVTRADAVAVFVPARAARRRRSRRAQSRLVNAINDDGRIYLTQTRVDGQVAIRFQAGQFETEARDVDMAFDVPSPKLRRCGFPAVMSARVDAIALATFADCRTLRVIIRISRA